VCTVSRGKAQQPFGFLPVLLSECLEVQLHLNIHQNRHLWAESRHDNSPCH
jgi:hypothetical protein